MPTPTRTALERSFYRDFAADRVLWSGRPADSPRFARQQHAAAALRQADGFVTPRAPEPLAEVDGADRETFLAGTHHHRVPFVVRGFARDTAAVREWSAGSLRERLRGVPCRVFVQDAESRTQSWNVGTGMEELPFESFLDRMADEHLYLNNATEVFAARPELVHDLALHRIRDTLTDPRSTWDELVTTNLFVGARHVFSAVHAAPGGNFFLNLVGRKKWTFVDPRYSAHLHALPGRPFQYLKSALGGSRAQQELGHDRHPLQDLPRFEVVLEPGDLLYNAPWWWHEVDNLDDFTVGCAVRHLPSPGGVDPTMRNHPLFSLLSVYPKFKAAAALHWLRHRVAGDRGTLRELAAEKQVRALQKGLSRGRARKPCSAA